MRSATYILLAAAVMLGCSDSTGINGPDCEFHETESVEVQVYLSCEQKQKWLGSATEWEIYGAGGCALPWYRERYRRGSLTHIGYLDLPKNQRYTIDVYHRESGGLRNSATFAIGENDTTVCLGP